MTRRRMISFAKEKKYCSSKEQEELPDLFWHPKIKYLEIGMQVIYL